MHSGGGAPELTADDKSKWAQWIALEVADGGQKAQANVLEKFGTCFDKTKFDAIQLGTLRTIRRQTGNNTQNLNENANNCTGCDNAPCRTCHSADDVTGLRQRDRQPDPPRRLHVRADEAPEPGLHPPVRVDDARPASRSSTPAS